MDIGELEKEFKNLGAQLVSTREEIKALKDSPRADPKEIKSLREDLDSFKKGWDEMLTKLTKGPEKPAEPAPAPAPAPAPEQGRWRFGFWPW